MADSYLKKAQDLKIKNPKITPQEIIKQIGQPPEGKRLESKGKGKVGYKSWDARRSARKGYNKGRSENIKASTGSLTKEQRAQNRAQEAEAAKQREAGQDVEILHKQRVGLTGPQLRRLPKSEQIAARRKLNKAYGGIGDKPENREIGSATENRQEDKDWEKVQGKLGEMEQAKPSLPNHPDLSQTLSPQEVRDLVGFNQNIQSAVTFGLNVANGAVRFGQAVGSVVSALAATEGR